MSSFLGIEIGKRGVLTHQTGLNVISHNLANSANEAYSRQKVDVSTLPPLYNPSFNRENSTGQIGQGGRVTSIARVRDEFIDSRILEESSNLAFYKTRDFFMKQIEHIINEPNGPSLKEKFDDFVKSWNDVALLPDDPSSRNALIASSQNMLGYIRDHYENLSKTRVHIDNLVRDKVNEINSLAEKIRDLNVEIVKIQALGDNPNDLLDKRDALIEKLSSIVNVNVVRSENNEIMVYLDSKVLVQGIKVTKLEVADEPSNDGMARVLWEYGEEVKVKSGELSALLQIRDNDILNTMKKLDNFLIQMIDSVNDIHRSGFGISPNTGLNFFGVKTITTDVNGNYDVNKDGQYDSTYIFKISGTQKVKLDDVIGESGFINLGPDDTGKDVIISYKDTDTVRAVINRINSSGARITAHIDVDGRLVLKGLYSQSKDFPDSVIRHLEDSGVFLTSFTGILKQSGPAGAFDYRRINEADKLAGEFNVAYQKNVSTWATLDEAILTNPMNIAARRGKDIDGDNKNDIANGKGDGLNALRIVALLTSENDKSSLDIQAKADTMPIFIDKNVTSFRPYFDSIVAHIGEVAKSDKLNYDKENVLFTGLKNMREEVSGVNIDEELVNLIKFQQGYQASAKIIQTMDTMLDIIMKLGR
ncbi:MAG TPA: flagellar hook-associated protein FlgK [Spirochaetota bacterium]|nr:flagellar hook-associated protein FlgK [Spirochaetota bacterium]HOM38600.1 flagellar hook-associated protein FlgK [Spirochaetota bacterium]HPQ49737.1 flagellar hook-associated protein FlgK [Spirochaetota bacterium]